MRVVVTAIGWALCDDERSATDEMRDYADWHDPTAPRRREALKHLGS